MYTSQTRAEGVQQELDLEGTTIGWAYKGIDVDALVKPLGLDGVYQVDGLDGERFAIGLKPRMTPLHIVRLAALEQERRGGKSLFFESIRVRNDGVIKLGVGS